MTKWKVLPREQCQGQLLQPRKIWQRLTKLARHTQLRGQLYHPELKYRREPEVTANVPQQAEPGTRFYPQARMAAQLAHLYQRDHILLPHKSINLREQHGHLTIAIGRSVRLLGGSNDFSED